MHSLRQKAVLALAGAAALTGGALGTQTVSAAPGTNTAEVILMYHDFYGPSSIWINRSTDGGATYGAPVNVVANFTATNPTEDAIVAADLACNTVPSSVKIVKSGSARRAHLRRLDRSRHSSEHQRLQRHHDPVVPQPHRGLV